VNVFVQFTVWFPVSFTAFISTLYTCVSVAGLVQLFVAAAVLFGSTSSAQNVFTPVIVSAHARCTTLSSSAFT
jgi:hypothetical protein